MLLTLAAFLLVLGPLIFVHELGHFLVAKAVGIQVLRFSLGFGRPIVAWVKNGTEYWISWIPLGGYVKMAGLDDEGPQDKLEGGKSTMPIDPTKTYDSKPLLARMAVILAGVTMNLIFAFLIYATLYATRGEPRMAITPVDSIDVRRLPPGGEPLATITRGDVISRINGDTITTWDGVYERLLDGPREARIEVAGRPEPVSVQLPADDELRARVALSLRPLTPARIGIVAPGQPAAKARLRLGDVIVRAGGDTVRSWDEMVRRIRGSPGQPLALDVLRGDSVVHVTVTPEAETQRDSAGNETTRGVIGASADPRGPTVRERVGLGTAIVDGARQTWFQVTGIAVMLKRLILGQVSTREVGGPILIAQMSGQMARLGIDWLLGFLAFFSVSLAVLNLLPIPVLDGGHFVFLIVEAIRRKPLSPQLRLRLTQLGMFVVLAIMVLAISNDVLRFFR